MTTQRKQSFSFGLADSVIAEVGGVPQKALHFDVEAILRSYEAIKPVAERLGVPAPVPRLAGFGYPSIASLGVEIVFTDYEPKPLPLIHSPEDIDTLKEPGDYLAAPLLRQRLALARELKNRCPQASLSIGHGFEGPATSAVLLMGENFLMLPYEDPARAHRLLDFCVRHSLAYVAAFRKHVGEEPPPGPRGMPDDFAGMFPPAVFRDFVRPYWEKMYRGLQATDRHLHSELLRKDHLPFLKELNISYFDPGADQYLTPELLQKECPVPFQTVFESWHIHDNSAAQLQEMYRRTSACGPYNISFSMTYLREEPKIQALLEVARSLS